MAEWSNATMTDVGADLQAKVNAGKTKLIFTKIKVGSGVNATNPLALTDVLSSKWETTNFVVKQEGKIVSVDTFITNNGITEAFRMSEIGLFAQDPDKGEVLYAYLTDPEPDRMPAAGGSVVVSQELTIGMIFSNTGNVSLTVNMGALVTREQLERHNTDANAHNEHFKKYLQLTGGTLIGDVIIENGKWMIYRYGDYEGDIRITPSGTMDVGVNRKGVVDNLNLCTKYRPGWYDGNSSAKPIATTEDINTHNTDENAHQLITSMIAKILGGSDWKANPAASLKDIKSLLGMGGIVAQRLEETGFIKFANGLIIQWGILRRVIESEQGGNWNEKQQVRRFPIQFATNKAILICGDSGVYSGDNALAAAVSGAFSVRGRIVDRTSFKIATDASDGTINADVSYIAIGI